MNILITGAKGFVGKNLCAALHNIKDGKDKTHGAVSDLTIYEYDLDSTQQQFDLYCQTADFVFNLAGVNRPKDTAEFMQGNFGFASTLLDNLQKYGNTCPVMLSSSTQAALDNPYGESKRAGEDLFFAYGRETGANVYVYRFPNIFGKWCRPNYNSAVATFCHNIAHDLPITVNDPNVEMHLVYIDDVVNELLKALFVQPTRMSASGANTTANLHPDAGTKAADADGFFTAGSVAATGIDVEAANTYCCVPVVHTIKLGQIAELIHSFKDMRTALTVPDLSDAFTRKLYATYLSYLPADQFAYRLASHSDARGSFTEIIRTSERGQFSVNISKPGIVKGNHWHHSKNEKFLVVSGEGVIRFRKIGTQETFEYFVSGAELEVVDIPTGYTHNIKNLGENDLITFMWASECFDPTRPDTFFEEV